MSAHQSDDDRKMKLDQVIDKARKLWDSSPEPVKKFPWNRALGNFIQLVLDLTLAVVKYLSVPLFVVTSISELSYCAHERKLVLVPFPVLLGASIAGILKETALELSPRLRVRLLVMHHFIIQISKRLGGCNIKLLCFLNDAYALSDFQVAEVPWHLIAIAIFFTLIKLPGPYYPYWGRILIPHFVNGVLLRTLWFAILWFRRPKALRMSDSIDNNS